MTAEEKKSQLRFNQAAEKNISLLTENLNILSQRIKILQDVIKSQGMKLIELENKLEIIQPGPDETLNG